MPTSLTAATALLRGFRVHSEGDRARVGLCRDLIADIRRLDRQLAANEKQANEKQMAKMLDEHGTRLREVDGIGALTAARLIGRTGRARRFPTPAAYANYNGSAPVQIASADTDRHRLPLRRPTTQQRALHHRGGPDSDARQYFGQFTILGTTLGSPTDFGRMLHFDEKHRIRPVIDSTWALDDVVAAHRHLESRRHLGKIVLVNKAG
nr:zinc-binding dehydrogenase [Rhodococcus wratislaviensis]